MRHGMADDDPETVRGPLVSRRGFIRGAALLGIGAAAGAAGTLATLSALQAPSQASLVRTPQGAPFTVADLPPVGGGLRVGVWESLPVVVFSVRRDLLRASAQARGYNTGQYALAHPTDPEAAVVAYDGRCTHLGCTVGWAPELGGSPDIPDYDGDGEPDGRTLCPCHQSQFDIYDLGNVVGNGPAPRPLDALRIDLRAVDPTGGDPRLALWGQARFRQETARQADRQGPGAPFSLDG